MYREGPCKMRICGDTTVCDVCLNQWDTGDFYEHECPYFDPSAGTPDHESVGPWWIGAGFVVLLLVFALTGSYFVRMFM